MLQRFPMDSCILSVPPDLRSPLSLVAHASSLHASGRCFAFTLQAGFCNFLPPVQGLRWIDPQHFFSFSVAGPSRSSLLSWWSLHMSAGSTCGASFFSGSIPCCDPNRVGYLATNKRRQGSEVPRSWLKTWRTASWSVPRVQPHRPTWAPWLFPETAESP